MTVSYLTQQELNDHLSLNGNLDANVRQAVIDKLKSEGIYNNNPTDPSKTAWVQEGAYTPPTVNFVQVLDITTDGTSYVQTDPALKAIVLQSPDPTQLYVTDNGVDHNNVYVALGTGHDSVNLYDGGNDTVLGGNGGDLIGGGAGASLLIGGSGNDSIYGGTGASTMIGGGGDNFIRVGGANQLAEGGGNGHNTIVDLGGYAGAGTSTLIAGTGVDTIYGYGGDTIKGGNSAPGSTGHSELHGGTSSYVESDSAASTYNVLGSGSTNSSNANLLQGGAGADSLYGGGGHDTLIAGNGNNSLYAGTGAHQSLMGGSGNDLLQDIYSGGTDTLTAGGGSGTQTLIGQQGDLFTSAGGASGNNVFWVNAGSAAGAAAGSTLTGGLGNDTFHIETHIGNDTITGGGGTDVVGFGNRSAGDIQSLTGSSGDYVLTFNDGQKITTHGVSQLYFGSDGQIVNLP